MIALSFTGGPRKGEKVQLRAAIATFGRLPSCDVVLDDPMVSGVHATLEQVPAGYIVTDQQSSNGTLINGDRIARALLRIGDELIIGSTGLKVDTSDGFAATIMHMSEGPTAAPHDMTMMPGAMLQRGPMVLEVLGAMGQGVNATPIPPSGLTIGRHPECGVVVNDPQVSGSHCRLMVGPEGPIVTDTSSNGTFVNEQRLARDVATPIKFSDSLRIGALTLRVREARPAQVGQAGGVTRPPPEKTAPPAAPPKWFLDVVDGMPPQRLEIPQSAPLTMGRLPTSSLVLTDPQASGQHCELTLSATGPVLSDPGSRNGTFIIAPGGADKRVQVRTAVPLKHGESFRIGAVSLRVMQVKLAANKLLPTERQVGDKRASVLNDLPIEQQLPKQLRGGRMTFIAGPRAGTGAATVPIERVVIHIGRASDNDVTLEDASVSARHCQLAAEEKGFVLVDNQSTNGCFVNGERVKGRRALIGGDLIRVGLDSVFEFQLEGAASQTFAGSSVVAEGAMSGGISPRFVIRGSVVKKWQCTIGRDVASDVFIDDPAIARSAIEIAFAEMKFVAKALAPGGLVVNGKIEGEEILKTGDQLSVGKWLLRVEITGARLTIHEQRDQQNLNASWAREVGSAAQAPVAPEAAQMAEVGGRMVLQTMFAADASQLEKIVPKREKKKAAPKWKATSDLLPDRNRGGAALIGLIAGAAVLAILFVGKRNSALLDGALARGHDSQKFTAMAHDTKLADGCNSCHTPMQKVAADRCQTCHTGLAPRAGVGVQAGHDHVSAKLSCASCHEEHKGAQRGEALVAKASCAKSGCHDTGNPPHQKLQKEQPTAFVAALKMPAPAKVTMPKGDAKQAQDKLHALHGGVTHKCMACHTASDGVSQGVATAACFRCHDAPQVNSALATNGMSDQAPDSSSCLGCHAMHDRTIARVPDAVLGPRWTGGVSGRRTAVTAAVTVMLMFVLIGGAASLYFGRRVDHVARMALAEPAKDGKKAKGGAAAEGEAVERVNDQSGVKLKVNVNKEKCVGCANCVNSCPTAVLEIVNHKSTVINEASCTSCRECEKVCPSGALTMAPEGAPPRLIDLPDLDSHFQTNVSGLYLIGEAAGKSLVKNAANLGKVVVDHMVATGLRPGDAARAGADVELVSVGSGPGGLSAALTAKSHGLSFAVIEKDRVYASTIQYCPKGKEFLAEPFDVKNVSLLPISDCTKEDLIAQWEVVLQRENIGIRLGEEVLDVRKEGELFVVTTSKGIVKALKVVMSPGTRGSPRKLGVPGQEHEKVSYMLVDPAEHQGHHVMVVGGGDSAVECAMSLASQAGNVVTLSYRKEAFARIKPRNQERIDEHARTGKVTVVFNSAPVEVQPTCVILKVKDDGGEKTVSVPNQFLYCLLGADLPMTWLQQMGVKYVKKPEGWNPGPTDQIVVKPGQVAA